MKKQSDVAVKFKRDMKFRYAGRAAADAAIKSGSSSFADAAKKIRRRHWMAGNEFFIQLFSLCRTREDVDAAMSALSLYPPKSPTWSLCMVNDAETRMVMRVADATS